MAENQDFYNFEEALDQLRLKEEELKRLVSEGEIRAFREGDTMRLRRQDVEHLKTELMGGEVVDLGGADEELVFEDDVDLEDTGMATEEIADMDTLLDEDVEDVGELDLDADAEDVVEAEPAPVARAAAAGAAVGARRAVAGAAVEEDSEGMMVRLALIATSAVLILGIPVAVSVSSGSPGAIARMIAGLFGKDF